MYKEHKITDFNNIHEILKDVDMKKLSLFVMYVENKPVHIVYRIAKNVNSNRYIHIVELQNELSVHFEQINYLINYKDQNQINELLNNLILELL